MRRHAVVSYGEGSGLPAVSTSTVRHGPSDS